MRRCFIHIGTHKTGSTSLQNALSTNRHKLESLGYLYPSTGRPPMAPHGQHNIAWEISRDYRFRKAYGTVDDLLLEIERTRLDVILSSEDFGSSSHHTKLFAAFISRLVDRQFDVKLVVYLRNQIEYARSLYLSLLLFGLDSTFCKYLEEILRHGQFRWRNWIFPFDYDDFLGRLECFDGVEVIVRSYDDVQQGTLMSDFLAILGIDPDTFTGFEDVRLNERISATDTVILFYRNCVSRWVRPSVKTALTSLVQAECSRFDMNDQSKSRMIERFISSNKRVSRAYGISGFDCVRVERAKSLPHEEIWMESVFSQRLRAAVKDQIKSMKRRGTLGKID